MKHILTILIGLFLFGCNSTTKTENNETKTELTSEIETEKTVDFDFDKFKIQKGQLGEIKIGMTISEAEMQFSGLTKKTDEATNFGFGGGSPAYLYYSGNELLFGLIPKLETDTLLFIIAAHKNLQTTNGLNPNSTVEELLKKYPDLTVQQDLMNSWEFFQDLKNGWDFIFMTDEQTEIGEYPELEVPSKPKRLTTKTDWITIR
ncbi:MAG: hypothetical protein ACJLTB_08320 [Algoriphagus aquaeductus]|uniref:hypothetical protein n=1 Tax=Algoriphagus aquaeductus TaxID=475299 RepID=UPI003879A026